MSTDHRATRDAIEPYSPPDNDDLPLFRFGMRQLLAFVSLVSLLMAAMAISGGLAAFVLLLATLVVSFHLFSTALGTQMRVQANRTLRQRGATADPDSRPADALRPAPQSQSRSP